MHPTFWGHRLTSIENRIHDEELYDWDMLLSFTCCCNWSRVQHASLRYLCRCWVPHLPQRWFRTHFLPQQRILSWRYDDFVEAVRAAGEAWCEVVLRDKTVNSWAKLFRLSVRGLGDVTLEDEMTSRYPVCDCWGIDTIATHVRFCAPNWDTEYSSVNR